MSKKLTCCGRTKGNGWIQEWYETASREAGKRARALRERGHRVTVGAMGEQVTRAGRVRLSLVTIFSDYAAMDGVNLEPI